MKKQQISETSDVGRERSAVATFGVLLERSRDAGGNLVDTNRDLGGHGIDRTGDLSHELLLGGEIGNGFDLVLTEELAFEKAALGLGLLGLLLESLNGLHTSTNIALDQNEGVGASQQGIKVGPGAVAINGTTQQGVFSDLANAVACPQTFPQIRHFLDGQALVIKNQCQLGLGEELLELSDDLLLALQSAAHRDVDRIGGTSWANGRSSLPKETRPRADPIPMGFKTCRVCLGRICIS